MSPTILRASVFSRLAGLLLAVCMLVPFLGSGALAVTLAIQGETAFALMLLLLATGLGFLTELVVREALNRLNWRIELGADSIRLDLPASRSYLAKPDAFTGELARAALKGVVWREERYPTLGMAVTVRAWALVLTDGRIILLGEDRPIANTGSYTTVVGETGTAIAAWLGRKPHQRAPVVGDAGLLGVWFTRAPDW